MVSKLPLLQRLAPEDVRGHRGILDKDGNVLTRGKCRAGAALLTKEIVIRSSLRQTCGAKHRV